ncbi:hypothetical protein ACLOJK_006653 [Asimina triloba]
MVSLKGGVPPLVRDFGAPRCSDVVPSLLEAKRKKEHSRKRVRPLEEGDRSVEHGPSSEGVFELPLVKEIPLVTDLGDKRGASLPLKQVTRLESREEAEMFSKREAVLSEVTRLREILEEGENFLLRAKEGQIIILQSLN